MRKRNTKSSRTTRALRSGLKVEVSEQEILADLLYPARAPRARRTLR